MNGDSRLQERNLSENQIPIAVPSFCSELSHAGQLYARQISALIDEMAHVPGALVYVHGKKLGVKVDGLDPMVFSAIDACSNLQVAQIHLAPTYAGAVSFVDFFVRRFPFSVQQIRTVQEPPFYTLNGRPGRQNFSAALAKRGIVHTLVPGDSRDAMCMITSRLMFSTRMDGMSGQAAERDHFYALTRFLLYHNNYRSIPWLDGNTPLQKLKSFDRYASLHSFCPSDDSDSRSRMHAVESIGYVGVPE